MKAMHLFFFVSESMGVKEASVKGRVNNGPFGGCVTSREFNIYDKRATICKTIYFFEG
jgi:hypothetical protein